MFLVLLAVSSGLLDHLKPIILIEAHYDAMHCVFTLADSQPDIGNSAYRILARVSGVKTLDSIS